MGGVSNFDHVYWVNLECLPNLDPQGAGGVAYDRAGRLQATSGAITETIDEP